MDVSPVILVKSNVDSVFFLVTINLGARGGFGAIEGCHGNSGSQLANCSVVSLHYCCLYAEILWAY